MNTDDTKLTLGIGADGLLRIDELSGPDGFNWTTAGSRIALIDRIDVAGARTTPRWTYRSATVDASDGVKVAVTFTNAEPAMELTSLWHARKGPGPVRHTMFLVNRSAKPVTIYEQESLDVRVAGPDKGTSVWYIKNDASTPDKIGVYHDPLTAGYRKALTIAEGENFIPYVVVDGGGRGVYLGWEWSIGRIAIASDAPGTATVKAGNGDAFKTDLAAGATFEVPPAFLGAYRGDLDDAANSLHKYLFRYCVPEVLRNDPTYPKVEWNAFAATGQGQGSWQPIETKYYPLIDDIAPLGFEEVVIDICWWDGDQTHQAHPPVGHKKFWPKDMLAACEYAHKHGMRFGLYWNCNPPMSTAEGIQHRKDDFKCLHDKFHLDFYRTDSTAGPVLQTGGFGPKCRAHYAEDLGYWQTKGFYEVADWILANVPHYNYENCSGGGSIKDYGVMRRAIRIQDQDRYYPIDARRAFYDSSFAMHPMQLSTLSGSWSDWQASGSVYEFRSASLGAPYWHPDAPNGGNGGPKWTAAQKDAIRRAVNTYKTKIRPLVRSGDLYHILPRPDDKVWDGIEYFDPAARRGAVYVFRPGSPKDAETIKLKGLDAKARYWLWCEDGAFAPMQKTGDELMTQGFAMRLPSAFSSDIVFIEDVALGTPAELQSPLKVLFIGNSYTAVNDLPALVAGLAEAAGGRKIEAVGHLVGGCTLEGHVTQTKALAKIPTQKWDVVVVQGHSLEPIIARERMFRYARVLDEAIQKQGAKTVFYLTWARQNIPEMQEGADPVGSPKYAEAMFQISGASKSADLASWCQEHKSGLVGGLNGAYCDIAKQLHASVAPVGMAWKKALAADPKLALHQADKSHPNLEGSYLAACVFYATLLDKSPVGLPGELRKGEKVLVRIAPGEAKSLQETAWQAVQALQQRAAPAEKAAK